MQKKICISVIGSGDDALSPQIAKIANEVGREIASRRCGFNMWRPRGGDGRSC